MSAYPAQGLSAGDVSSTLLVRSLAAEVAACSTRWARVAPQPHRELKALPAPPDRCSTCWSTTCNKHSEGSKFAMFEGLQERPGFEIMGMFMIEVL